MQMDDTIIISVDDHAIETPEAFVRHYPEGKKDRAPRIVQDNGKDIWRWNGQRVPTIGLNAFVGRPRSVYGKEPGRKRGVEGKSVSGGGGGSGGGHIETKKYTKEIKPAKKEK